MKVRTKAFFQTIGAVTGGAGTVILLDFITPKYGLVIFMSGLLIYLMWIMYNLRVSMLEREQDKIVDILKE